MTQWHRRSLRRACCRLCLKRMGAPRWTVRMAKQRRAEERLYCDELAVTLEEMGNEELARFVRERL